MSAATQPAPSAPPAAPGHNKPPADADPLRERLANDHKPLADRAAELVAALDRVPKEIIDDETSGRAQDLVRMMQACAGRLKDAHKLEKEPHLKAGRTIDAFFRTIAGPLDAAKRIVESRIQGHLRRKATLELAARKATGEAPPAKLADVSRTRSDMGSVASLTPTWTFEVTDWNAIDLDPLRPHLLDDRNAIEKAIRAFVKAGGRKLEGVRIFEDQALRVK